MSGGQRVDVVECCFAIEAVEYVYGSANRHY